MKSCLKHILFCVIFYNFSACIASNLYAQTNQANELGTLLNLSTHKTHLLSKDFEEVKQALWDKYLSDVKNLTQLKTEYDNRALKFKDKIMRFSLEKRGTAPKEGYPLYIALHGGGQTSSGVNDSQWEHMKIYYKDSVQQGIYIATRGITNNWNLHFEEESYPLYDKLIESAILFDNVNPNRVYLLGFSAGGDGVYQIVPRMPERFAAGNMSAGHHNWITFDNLYNTPFLIQVGEHDSAYSRNRVAAENGLKLTQLHTQYGGGYTHDVFVHYNGWHNGWFDNDASFNAHPILANPIDWLNNGNREFKQANTNAINWLDKYIRPSSPKKLVWDLSIGAKERLYQTGSELLGTDNYSVQNLAPPKSLFYWLDVSVADNYPDNGKLVVEANNNTINVLEAKNIDKFRILLNPTLLDLSAPINIEVEHKLIGTITVEETLETMIRTLLERSDKEQIYDAQITLAYDHTLQKWEIVP